MIRQSHRSKPTNITVGPQLLDQNGIGPIEPTIQRNQP